MEFRNLTYLLLLIGTIAGPLAFSFDNKIQYFRKFKYLFPAILFSGAIFILWDLRFEELGIWNYNPDYILGIYIMNLPFEKWLYFFVIPYSFVFIYEVLSKLPGHFEKPNVFVAISLVLLVLFTITAYYARQHIYTFFTFFLLTIYFGYTIFRNRFKPHLSKFYYAWFASLIPFMIINGLITALPIKTYNEEHILGYRFFSIPVEDFFYLFLLLLINITIYEYMKHQQLFKFPKNPL